MEKVIKIIKWLPEWKARSELILLFIKELSRNIQNCNSVWEKWWADWSEVIANKVAVWHLKYIERLENILINNN